MQAVILAAGKGTRMRPLTYTTPKPLAQINGKSLIEHNLAKLPPEITEVIFVIGYLGEKIKKYFGKNFQGRKITYIEQKEKHGSGYALYFCKDILRDNFLVLMGDDLYSKKDILNCLKTGPNCLLAKKTKQAFTGGNILLDKNNNLAIIEEGNHPNGGLINTGLYVLDENIFKYQPVKISNTNEYGLPQTLAKLAQKLPVKVILASCWTQISNLEDLKKAEKKF